MQSTVIRLQGVNKCTQEISELIKLHILGVLQNAPEIY